MVDPEYTLHTRQPELDNHPYPSLRGVCHPKNSLASNPALNHGKPFGALDSLPVVTQYNLLPVFGEALPVDAEHGRPHGSIVGEDNTEDTILSYQSVVDLVGEGSAD
jgi:hypothetical protein